LTSKVIESYKLIKEMSFAAEIFWLNSYGVYHGEHSV
jgi:hypothetical protein